ncbi:NmrA family NAD(P)-binding protein, partial [Solirubrobacter ginsenosidimutans]
GGVEVGAGAGAGDDAAAGRGAAGTGGGVEVVAGSFDDAVSLRAALDGVSVLFLTGRDNPAQVEQHLRVLRVAREAGVRHVVKLSAIGARADSPVALMRWHHAIEAALRGSDFAWTFLRPHLYLQNLLRFAADVADRGRLAAPMGERSYPLVDTRDVGAAVAAVLRDPVAHAGRAYALTGPSAVSYAEIAVCLARLVGRRVEYEAVAPEAFRAGLLDAGLPAWRADDLAAISAAYDDSVVSDELPALLGRPATSFGRFLDDHREVYLVGASRSHL